MTIKEYCAAVGVSQPAVSYRIKQQKPIPGIKSYKFVEAKGEYVLTVNKDQKIDSKLRQMFNSRKN